MLTEEVERFVALRRIGGFKYGTQAGLLRSFAKFAAARGETQIRTETVIDWAARGSSVAASEIRLQTIIVFARHCRAEDPRHEVPPSGVFGRGYERHPVAHIFSPEEITSILAGALELPPKASLRPHTCQTVFGLLAATGLRIGEALRLQFRDITADGLLIRETKFNKSRVVPVHRTTSDALERYTVLRRQLIPDGDHLFVGLDGKPSSVKKMSWAFQTVVAAVGLATARRGKRPRLHDLRHTWAVRALESSPRDVGQIDRHMRAVMTYLGHANVASGYWYLHSTPFLMKRIADARAEREGDRT